MQIVITVITMNEKLNRNMIHEDLLKNISNCYKMNPFYMFWMYENGNLYRNIFMKFC